MKQCANCGAELADEAKFCNKCGCNQEMTQRPSPAASSKKVNKQPKKGSKGPLIAIIIIALILILGTVAVIMYLKKEKIISNTDQHVSVEQKKDYEEEETDAEEVSFDDPEDLMETYIDRIKDSDEKEIKLLYEKSEENFSLEDHDILFDLKNNKAEGEIEYIGIVRTIELDKSLTDEAIEDLEKKIKSTKEQIESNRATSTFTDVDLKILERVILTSETFLDALKKNDPSELCGVEIETSVHFGVDSDFFQSDRVEDISLVGLIHRTEKGCALLGIIYPDAVPLAPAPEAAPAETEETPAAREAYTSLHSTSTVAAEAVPNLVKRIDAMRVSTDQYVTEGAEYVLIGDVANRDVIYCNIGMSDSEMKALMEENGYYDYRVQYYFDNPINGDSGINYEGPNCAHLVISGKDYWYYFASNSLIRRKTQESVTDNMEPNGFISEIYRMGHDFAEKILYQFGDYVIPDSDKRLINAEELQGMSPDNLRLASNEIYARHGRKFKDPDLQEYFNNRSWYYGTIEPDAFSESMLSQIEKDNVELINLVRSQME